MDNTYYLIEKWQEKGRLIALSALILFSLTSIHYVTFSFSVPAEFRVLLDVSFKAEFAASFFVVATFSIIVARYSPQGLLAMGVFCISEVINFKYHRRGYRRVATIWGVWAHRHSKEARYDYKKKLSKFGRNDARLDNFIRGVVQKRLPILFYEEHKATVTVPLAIFIGLLFYVGFTWACWLFFIAVILERSLSMYFAYNDRFRFSLRIRYSGDDPDHEPGAFTPDASDLLIVAITLAIVVGIAGPLRLQHITREANVNLLYDEEEIRVALIGGTAHGLLFFDQEFGFIPFSNIREIRKLVGGQ